MDVVTKSVEATVLPVESDHPNGEFKVVLSTEALDRDGENLWIDEWKQPLPARIHIDGDHGHSIDKTVGSVVPRIEGNKLVGDGLYAPTPYAQMVRSIVNDKDAEGHGLSMSVTYAEKKNQKDGKPQRELLNAAFVAIPANPEAVVLASKAADTGRNVVRTELARLSEEHPAVVAKWVRETFEARDKAEGGIGASGNNPDVKHDDMVQAIHDAAFQLGAQCLNAVDADPGTSDGANKGFSWPISTTKPKVTTQPLEPGPGLTDRAPETSSPEAGSPQESAEESAAPAAAEKSAAADAADNSADNAAHQKAKEAEKARGLAYLISMSMKDQ